MKNKNRVGLFFGELIGTVTEKAIVDGHYTVTIGAYASFLLRKNSMRVSMWATMPQAI